MTPNGSEKFSQNTDGNARIILGRRFGCAVQTMIELWTQEDEIKSAFRAGQSEAALKPQEPRENELNSCDTSSCVEHERLHHWITILNFQLKVSLPPTRSCRDGEQQPL